MKNRFTIFSAFVLVTACAADVPYDPLQDYVAVDAVAILDAPGVDPGRVAPEDRAAITRGEYLVELLGCGSCHTDGALIGEPRADRSLAGSKIGIAYTSPLENRYPGIVFPPNLTPDPRTGIGSWSDRQIADAIRAGRGRHGDRGILVMPWQAYAKISEADARAIVGYLRNIDPVEHRVPDDVPQGRRATDPFVHFGVYRSRY